MQEDTRTFPCGPLTGEPGDVLPPWWVTLGRGEAASLEGWGWEVEPTPVGGGGDGQGERCWEGTVCLLSRRS